MHNPFGHHQPEPQQPHQAPHGGRYPPPIQGETVKIYCEANPDFLLASRNGSVVMVPANVSDPSQQWIMDTSWSVKVEDDAGFPAFALVNKATGQSLTHGCAEKDKVTLGPYHPGPYHPFDLNKDVLFTRSADVGRGYQCIRPVNDTHLNLDASAGDDKHHVALSEGTEIILCKWNKKESQKWKISPILGSSQANVEPQGSTVRIRCEANPEFFLAARGDAAELAQENPRDPQQIWIKDDKWGIEIQDREGYPAFALVNKGTQRALKHGDRSLDQLDLGLYDRNVAEMSALWSLSPTHTPSDENRYRAMRTVENTALNMDAKGGEIRQGTRLILFEWKARSNQKWKLHLVD